MLKSDLDEIEKLEEELLRKVEKKKKKRLRIWGPYRKANTPLTQAKKPFS